jgi:hypothetical protein
VEEKLKTSNGNSKNSTDNFKRINTIVACKHCGSSNLIFGTSEQFDFCQNCLTAFQSCTLHLSNGVIYTFNFFSKKSWADVLSKYGDNKSDLEIITSRCPFRISDLRRL